MEGKPGSLLAEDFGVERVTDWGHCYSHRDRLCGGTGHTGCGKRGRKGAGLLDEVCGVEDSPGDIGVIGD